MAADRATDDFHLALQADNPSELYEHAPCAYLTLDGDGRVAKTNRTFLTWTGLSEKELVSRPFSDLLTPGYRIYAQTHLYPLLHMHGEAREIAVDLVRRDGHVVPALLNATLHDAGDGNVWIRMAIFNATERRRYEQELVAAMRRAEESERRARTLARTLQQTLIPPDPPDIPGLDTAAGYRPAGDGTEVGGDFYDVFPIDKDTWCVLVGDVCGKGAEAAVVSALARHAVRGLLVTHARPAQVLHGLNEVLNRNGSDRYCTVVLATFQPSTDGARVTLALGGHPQPVLLGQGEPPTPFGVHGPLVGVFQEAEFTDTDLQLRPGQTLLMYTDGITEARSPEGLYGEERLMRAIAGEGRTPQELVHRLVADVLAFQDGDTRDDIAVVAVRVPPR